MNARPETVLVTGAGGFVGSAVVRALVDAMRQPVGRPAFPDGRPLAHVVAMVRPHGSTERLAELPDGPEWSILRADLSDPDAAEVIATVRPRTVMHLALDSACHEPQSDQQRTAMVGRPLELLFNTLRSVPGANLVTTGSVAVIRPGDALAEDAPKEPNPAYLHYARAKLLEEEIITQLGTATAVRWTHLRLFYLFGRHEKPSRLLPYLCRTLARGEEAQLSSGTQRRDYTDVDDVASAYLRALGAPDRLGSRCYHVGSGQGMTVREFAEAVATVVGRPDLLRFGARAAAELEGATIVADVRRIREELAWSVPDPRARIRRAAEWYLQQVANPPAPLGGCHAMREE
ncbi:MAG: NAD(P)-dependent oxidoreductase [Gemmatimonadales bacterium]|nr:NAD(P)-dependent oxidoreductase [Gemmatimonadales bacterium]